MNQRYVTLDTLSRKEKTLIGLGLISLSLISGISMYLSPIGLKVPIYIAIIALSIFFITGLAILLHGIITREKYHLLMQGIILLMSIIPLWIAFDPAEKQCRANFFFLSGELPCRIGFGIGGMLIFIVFLVSFTSVFRKK